MTLEKRHGPGSLRGILALALRQPHRPLATARLIRDVVAVRSSPLFDADWYRARYPDVEASRLDSALHYLRHGAAEGRDPGPDFSSVGYLAMNPDVVERGVNPLVHYQRSGRTEGRQWLPQAPVRVSAAAPPVPARLPIYGLRTVAVSGQSRRVTLVTERIGRNQVLDGADIAIIVTVFLAERLGARLRVATRVGAPERGNILDVLRYHQVEWPSGIEFTAIDHSDSSARLEVSETDVFVATSWWTTTAIRKSVPAGRTVYLLQEDERLLQPTGDEVLQASEVLKDPTLHYIVASRLLHEHLVDSSLTSLARRAVWFEPAVPPRPRSTAVPLDGGRRNLLVHASPTTPATLYHRGVAALDAAIRRGVIDPRTWSITFVGSGAGPVALAGGVTAVLASELSLADYADLLASTQLGLSLVHGPQLPYRALEMAASSVPVVTNQFGRKISLDEYSGSLICVEADIDALVEGLARGVALTLDVDARAANDEASHVQRSWGAALHTAIGSIASHL